MWRLESGVWSLENQLNQLLIYVFIYGLNVFFYFCILHDLHLYNKKSTYCKLVMGHYNSIFMPGAHLERWHTKKTHKIFLFIMYLLYCCCCSLLFFFKILQAAKVKGAV